MLYLARCRFQPRDIRHSLFHITHSSKSEEHAVSRGSTISGAATERRSEWGAGQGGAGLNRNFEIPSSATRLLSGHEVESRKVCQRRKAFKGFRQLEGHDMMVYDTKFRNGTCVNNFMFILESLNRCTICHS